MLKLPSGTKKQSVCGKLTLRLRDVPQAQPTLSSGQCGPVGVHQICSTEQMNPMEGHLAANQDHALLARCAFARRLLLQLQIAMNDKPGGKKNEEKLRKVKL